VDERKFAVVEAAAARSLDSRNEATELYVAGSGRGTPAGGIAFVRSLRTIFSQPSPPALTLARPAGSMRNPPVFRRVLWQVTQY
jgi:hypothetical protein